MKNHKITYRTEEKAIEHQVEGVLRKNGYYVQKMQVGTMYIAGRMIRMAAAGTPDILAIKDGRCLFVEVKRPKHEPTVLQVEKMKELESYKAKCVVVHSSEEMELALNG